MERERAEHASSSSVHPAAQLQGSQDPVAPPDDPVPVLEPPRPHWLDAPCAGCGEAALSVHGPGPTELSHLPGLLRCTRCRRVNRVRLHLRPWPALRPGWDAVRLKLRHRAAWCLSAATWRRPVAGWQQSLVGAARERSRRVREWARCLLGAAAVLAVVAAMVSTAQWMGVVRGTATTVAAIGSVTLAALSLIASLAASLVDCLVLGNMANYAAELQIVATDQETSEWSSESLPEPHSGESLRLEEWSQLEASPYHGSAARKAGARPTEAPEEAAAGDAQVEVHAPPRELGAAEKSEGQSLVDASEDEEDGVWTALSETV